MRPHKATHVFLPTRTKPIERRDCLFPCGHRIIDRDGNPKAEYFCEDCAVKAGLPVW
jgi:hypothetical protein